MGPEGPRGLEGARDDEGGDQEKTKGVTSEDEQAGSQGRPEKGPRDQRRRRSDQEDERRTTEDHPDQGGDQGTTDQREDERDQRERGKLRGTKKDNLGPVRGQGEPVKPGPGPVKTKADHLGLVKTRKDQRGTIDRPERHKEPRRETIDD
nr:transcription elongation factor A protein-like 5 [Penaeus vannamei]